MAYFCSRCSNETVWMTLQKKRFLAIIDNAEVRDRGCCRGQGCENTGEQKQAKCGVVWASAGCPSVCQVGQLSVVWVMRKDLSSLVPNCYLEEVAAAYFQKV